MKHRIVISNEDVMFSMNGNAFNGRVVGLLMKDNRVLLAKNKGDKHWTLPGGKIRHFEVSSDSVVREFEEEIGGKFVAKKLLSVIENFYVHNTEKWHQIIFVYEMEDIVKVPLFKGSKKILDADGVYRWFELNELNDYDVQPEVLRTLISNVPCHLVHKVNYDM